MRQPDILPDSRLRESKGAKRAVTPLGTFNWIPIFCANCGAEGGMVPEEHKTFAFWLCNNCFETYGVVAGTMAIPDEVFWAKVAEDQQKKES